VDLLSKYEIEPNISEEYWKDRGLSTAVPDDSFDSGDGDGAPSDEATGLFANPTDGGIIGSAEGIGLPPSSTGELMTATGLKKGTTGRLYFGFDTDPEYYCHVCSATVVNSATHDLLATAAHCVWDTRGDSGLVSWLTFVPGDQRDAEVAPYGVWYGAEIYLRKEFENGVIPQEKGISGDGWAYDYAFVRLAPNSAGKKIQDVVGAQGIAFGIPAETLVVIGYPTAEPFDGYSERYCSSWSWDRYRLGGYQIECNLTPGASGGGWFTRWDPVRGAGYLVATTSTRAVGSLGPVLGANALGKNAFELFEWAGGVADGLFEGETVG
jgi:V8-like Glu-specific endopeptidase